MRVAIITQSGRTAHLELQDVLFERNVWIQRNVPHADGAIAAGRQKMLFTGMEFRGGDGKSIVIDGDQGAVGRTPQAHGAILVPTEDTLDRKSTRLNSSHMPVSRMPSSA